MLRTLGKATALATAAVMVWAGTAFADNLQSDLNTTTGGLQKTVARGTLSPATSYSQNVFLFAEDTGSGGLQPTYPFNVNLGTASPSTFGTAFSGVTIGGPGTANGQTGQVSWTTPAAQATTQNYSLIVSFDAATSINENPATVTINFSIAAAPSDSTPPSIGYVLNPASPDGSNGWYRSNVSLTWTVTESESPSSLVKTGCVDQNITADQQETTYSCSATSDGGSSGPVDVKIKRDATAPTASASASPPPNGNGWNNTDVTVSFSGNDATSGIASCSPNIILSSEGAGQSASGTCTDTAGNVSSQATASGINIDKTKPSVSLNGGPADGGAYYFGFVPAAPTCDASDGLSGLDGSCSVSGYSSAVGTHTVTASATDRAGNSNSASATYEVKAWTLGGFYQPVDMNGVLNTVKGGSTVPLKFEIFAGATELTTTDRVKSFSQAKVYCDGSSPTDEVEVTTTGGTSLRYDSTAGQFVQNWQTPKQPGQCYRVTMTTQDGSSLAALFKLR